MEEASDAARHLGISHSTIDLRDEFIKKVVKPFIRGYSSGLTPNPCILCNRLIKFRFLLAQAEKTGAGYISTGHYARVEKNQDAGFRMQDSGDDMFFLKKGIDPKKDQSYVLYALGQRELKKLILPLGHSRKDEVRKIAQELNLPAAKKPESQEICFVEDRSYFKFIEELTHPEKTGPIVDMNGRVIGKHKGIHEYTIGQRKRLGVSSTEPLYVIKIDAIENTIYAGSSEAAKKKEFFVKDLKWINPHTSLLPSPRPPAKKGGGGKNDHKNPAIGGKFAFRASVKIRSMMKDEPATITLSDKTVQVIFDEPQWAPAPGQSAVFYDGEILMGGGVII
jgi:tRNA-specific 2-thiouridylase